MINRRNKQEVLPSFAPKFSDPDLIKSVLRSEFWKSLFMREKKALWILLKAIFFLKIEMFISPLKTVLRYGHGRRTIGTIITLMSALMMIAFNTKYVVGYLASFFPLIAPIIPFFMDSDAIYNAAFVEVRSTTLMYFWIAYLALSAIHLGCIYWGKGGSNERPDKRGTSLLYVTLFKHLKVPEYLVQRFIEPIVVGGAGCLLCATDTDFTLGLFLSIGALCLLFQECYDGIMHFTMSQ